MLQLQCTWILKTISTIYGSYEICNVLFSFSPHSMMTRTSRDVMNACTLEPFYFQHLICHAFRYNRVFCFLLVVRRTQIDLLSCWSIQMSRKFQSTDPHETIKWQLRNHMSFLIDNLQYYLQVRSYQGSERVLD